MGNSKAKPGIFINLQKPFYFPGELVKGCVYINAQNPFPVNQIVLGIFGNEKIWWQDGQGQNIKISNYSQDSSGTKPSNKKIPLAGDRFGDFKIIQTFFLLNSLGNNGVLHGQFAYPFEFVLPNYIPGTFKQERPNYKGMIFYQIQCKCISKGNQDLIATQELVIRQPKKLNQQSLFGEVFLYPQTCLCRKNGVSRICCYFQKNQYFSGQQCIAICEADNYKCSLKINQIKVKFIKEVTLFSAFGQQNCFRSQINTASFPGVPAFGQYVGPQAQKIIVPLYNKDSESFLQPSVSGRYVKCQYYLEITPELGGCCLKNGNSFTVQLNIIQKQNLPQHIQQPENWNPAIYRTSSIMLNQNFENQYIKDMGKKQDKYF